MHLHSHMKLFQEVTIYCGGSHIYLPAVNRSARFGGRVPRRLKCAFLKNDFIYECTSNDLNIFRHQIIVIINFDEWICSTDTVRCIRNESILRKRP